MRFSEPYQLAGVLHVAKGGSLGVSCASDAKLGVGVSNHQLPGAALAVAGYTSSPIAAPAQLTKVCAAESPTVNAGKVNHPVVTLLPPGRATGIGNANHAFPEA
ncbi:hypothetical protein PHYPSEUDO_006704 [Phytophthora pseudosyringae]|uniref:Uncharacterized protein n=1 Tax=Phytophthora pseudosyringae TaxID=221518 RepID=A0A8T1VKY1_9STRA|nr:hypothetical protein PHYPSEUDO_006704 [Phytophthora pseudosyringae]